MVRRRGAVYGDRESDQVIEVGLDELFGTDSEGVEDDPDLSTDDGSLQDDADLGVPEGSRDDKPGLAYDEWREDESDLASASLSAAFFGWLVASGTAVLLVALVSGICTLIGWQKLADWSGSRASTGWPFVGAWIVLVLAVGIGAYSGGYASGRMVPSHGGRQGLGVWFFSWCAAGLIAGLGYLADRKYDLVARIDWPTLPIAEADRMQAAVVALVAILLVTLVGAVLGGAAGNSRSGRLRQIDLHEERMTDRWATG
jgi:hypothetical protein